MNDNSKAQIAKELTLEAIKAGLIKVSNDDLRDSEIVGQSIAKMFNAILNSVQC